MSSIDKAFRSFLADPPDVTKLVKHLKLHEGEAQDESLVQPMIFWDAVKVHAASFQNKEEIKAELERAKGDKSLTVRRQLTEEAGSARVTNDQVAAKVGKSKDIRELEDQLIHAETHEMLAKGLVEAFRQRSVALRMQGDMTNAEVYVNRRSEGQTSQLTELREKMDKKYKKGK